MEYEQNKRSDKDYISLSDLFKMTSNNIVTGRKKIQRERCIYTTPLPFLLSKNKPLAEGIGGGLYGGRKW